MSTKKKRKRRPTAAAAFKDDKGAWKHNLSVATTGREENNGDRLVSDLLGCAMLASVTISKDGKVLERETQREQKAAIQDLEGCRLNLASEIEAAILQGRPELFREIAECLGRPKSNGTRGNAIASAIVAFVQMRRRLGRLPTKPELRAETEKKSGGVIYQKKWDRIFAALGYADLYQKKGRPKKET